MTELSKWGDKLHDYQKIGQSVIRKFYTNSRGASAENPLLGTQTKQTLYICILI